MPPVPVLVLPPVLAPPPRLVPPVPVLELPPVTAPVPPPCPPVPELDIDPLQALAQGVEAQASRFAAATMAFASFAAAFTHWF